MFLNLFPISSEKEKNQLKELAEILETYPRVIAEGFLLARDIDVHHREKFNQLFDCLQKHYEEGIQAYGWDSFLKNVKELEPIIPFMSQHVKDENHKKQIIARVIYSDLRNYFYRPDNFVSLSDDSYNVQAHLGLHRDDDDLVTVDDRFELRRQGIIFSGHDLIFYHPFLRRFFSANFTEITTCIMNLSNLKNCVLKIAIDPFRISRRESYKEIFEFDHWWGNKFDAKKLDDPYYQYKAVYSRNPKHENNLTWPVDRIEIKVKHRSNQKIFEIEEITPAPSALIKEEYKFGGRLLKYSDKYRFVKYTHFIWDVATQHFCHLDVSVIIYDLQKYEERFLLNHPPIGAVEKIDKIKLVRIDGLIPLEAVENLCTDFYRYNELIGEFFAGE